MQQVLLNYMYLVGFIYAITIAIPLSFIGIRTFHFVSTFSKRAMYAVVIIISTILSPHLTNPIDAAIILLLSSAAIFMAVLSEYNKSSHAVGSFMILLSTAYYLNHFDSYTRLIISGIIFALIALSVKANPQRNTLRVLNPYVVFMILTIIPSKHLIALFLNMPAFITGTVFFRIIYCYLIPKISSIDQIVKPILSLNKFYLFSCFSTFIIINPHVLQVS